MKIVIDLGSSKSVMVPAWKRVSISFDKEYSDPDGIHKDGNFPDWLPETAAFYIATLTLVADGQADGEKLKLTITEYERDSDTRIRDLVGEDKVGNGTRSNTRCRASSVQRQEQVPGRRHQLRDGPVTIVLGRPQGRR